VVGAERRSGQPVPTRESGLPGKLPWRQRFHQSSTFPINTRLVLNLNCAPGGSQGTEVIPRVAEQAMFS